MGITGEIVRSVFARNSSHHTTQSHHINGVEKKRWRTSVRSYLCGDHERNEASSLSLGGSTGAEVGFGSSSQSINITTHQGGDVVTSGRSSEATVDQPNESDRKHNSTSQLFLREDAALIIQSAFRTFRAKCVQQGANILDVEHRSEASPSRDSISTSVEVQTGNSSDIFSIKDETPGLCPAIAAKPRVSKIQEDWDDSTVSSVMLKTRIQNRVEAATRRERALAYAFSQQLRICSKRKQSTGPGDDETSTGWSWLERWMAAKEDNTMSSKKIVDGGSVEEESCGSNEVSSMFEGGVRKPKSRSNRTSGQRSRSSHRCPRDPKVVVKRAKQQYPSMNKR